MPDKSPINRRIFGQRIERQVARHLKQQGLKLLTSNFTCRVGEIDLIMQEKPHTLVFVEVRYRSQADYGSPLESITAAKQQRIRRTAAYFLQRQPASKEWQCRFDVVGVAPATDKRQLTIDWIPNAFY